MQRRSFASSLSCLPSLGGQVCQFLRLLEAPAASFRCSTVVQRGQNVVLQLVREHLLLQGLLLGACPPSLSLSWQPLVSSCGCSASAASPQQAWRAERSRSSGPGRSPSPGRALPSPRPPRRALLRGAAPSGAPPPGSSASRCARQPLRRQPRGGCRGRPGPGGLGLGAAVLRSGGPVVGSLPPDVLADGVTSREELLRWFGDVRGAVAKVALVPGDGGGLVSHLLSRGRLRPGPSRPGPSLPRPPRALPPGWRRRRGGSGRRGRGSGVPAPGALKPAPLYAPSL